MANKIAMISDIHFGVRNNSEQYLEMIKTFFIKTLADVLVDKKITDVRILGDLFDCRNNVNVRTLNVVLETFEWYEKNHPHIIFTMFPGNHDVYYRNKNDVNIMKIFKTHNNIVVHENLHHEKIGNKKVLSVPWLVEATEDEMKFSKICEGSEKYDLLLGHFEIRDFEISKGHVDETGKDHGTFKNFTRVFSGHYHGRNTINQISYLGCPYELCWSDYQDVKGIHIYNVDTNETEFIPNTLSPIHVKVNIEDLQKKNMSVINKIPGNYVQFDIDKKVDDTWLVKATAKIESMKPLSLKTENHIVDELELIDNSLVLSNTGSPQVFLHEYVENVEITDTEVDKDELNRQLDELYQSCLT